MCNHSTCKLTQISWAVDEKTSSLLASTLPAYVKLDGIDSTLREAVIKIIYGQFVQEFDDDCTTCTLSICCTCIEISL